MESAGDETVSALDHEDEPSEWITQTQGASPLPDEVIAKRASQAGGGRLGKLPSQPAEQEPTRSTLDA